LEENATPLILGAVPAPRAKSWLERTFFRIVRFVQS
jgi:hypothetical protein